MKLSKQVWATKCYRKALKWLLAPDREEYSAPLSFVFFRTKSLAERACEECHDAENSCFFGMTYRRAVEVK
jgi:hypothetical protein